MRPKTALEALRQFSKTEAFQTNPRLLDNLRTVLRRYVLLSYGFTSAELSSDLDACLSQLPLSQLLGDATQLLANLNLEVDRNSSSRKISRGTINNYRSALMRFFGWMQGQGWYPLVSNSKIAEHAPPISNNQTLAKARKGGRKLNAHPYALKEEDLTPKLRQQLEQLHNFWTSPETQARKGRAIKEATFKSYRAHVLSNLGWLHNIQGQKPEQLSLEQVADSDHLQAFINWGIQQKGNSYGWAINIVQVAVSVAKWLYTQPQSQDPRDSPQVVALQSYLQTLRKHYHQKRTHVGREELLSPEQGMKVVEYLRQRCALYDSSGIQRSETAILKSWQRYLIVALMAFSPLRQREIRQLEWQQSLYRDQDGYWVRFDAGQQLGKRTKVSQQYQLSKHLTSDLDDWFQQWRPKIPTDSQLVFTRLGSNRTPESLGEPLTDRDISDLIAAAVYKASSVLFDVATRGTPQTFQHLSLTYLGQISQFEQASPIGGPTVDAIKEVQRVNRQGIPSLIKGPTVNSIEEVRRVNQQGHEHPAEGPNPATMKDSEESSS